MIVFHKNVDEIGEANDASRVIESIDHKHSVNLDRSKKKKRRFDEMVLEIAFQKRRFTCESIISRMTSSRFFDGMQVTGTRTRSPIEIRHFQKSAMVIP